MMKAEDLAYEIADEYLPDVNILGVDGPNTGLAGEIINKVLDAVMELADDLCDLGGDIPYPDFNESINKLRP